MWCDSVDHRKWQCAEMNDALAKGLIRMNEANRVANAVTGQEIPGMTGRGGMKVFFAAATTQQSTPATTPAVAPTPAAEAPYRSSTSVISISDLPTATIGTDASIRLITLHEDGSETHEFIDADVNVKRRGTDLEDQGRRVRFRSETYRPDETPTPSPPTFAARAPIPSPIPPTVPLGTATAPAANAMPNLVDIDIPMQDGTAAAKERRFRLASELRESISIAEIGEKIMNMPIQLSLKELMATAPDLSNHFHEITRKRRIPVPGTTPADPVVVSTVSSATHKPLYACPSGRVKVLVEDTVAVNALLDKWFRDQSDAAESLGTIGLTN
jgi:hypothetical protein